MCITEIGAAARFKDEFSKRNVKLCAFSCCDVTSHKIWIDDIKATTGAHVEFPIFADVDRAYANILGILDMTRNDKNTSLPLLLRAVYILYPGNDHRIAAVMIYPNATGRNFSEFFRVIDALKLTSKYPVSTPADWTQGDKVLLSSSLADSEADKVFEKVSLETRSNVGLTNLVCGKWSILPHCVSRLMS